jgi:hypothetical protein
LGILLPTCIGSVFLAFNFFCFGASTNMPHAQLAGLRNGSNKGGEQSVTPDFTAFLAKWRAGLRGSGGEWDGILALAELKRRDVFRFLLGEGKWEHDRQTRHLFRKMFYEIEVYRKEAAPGRFAREYLGEGGALLLATAHKFHEEENRVPVEDLKRILKSQRDSNIRAAAQVRLLEVEQELKFGFWEEMIWRDLPKRNVVARKIELDTRLQVELAKVLSFYLREKKVSLLTIAHLILLAYWAGNLSEVSEVPQEVSQQGDEKEEGTEVSEVPQKIAQQEEREKGGSATSTETVTLMTAIYTRRPLRARNIYDNLREAGLHKTAIFKGEGYAKFMAKLEQAKSIVGPAGSGLRILYLLYLSDFATARGLTRQRIGRLIRTQQTAQRATSSESDA